MPQIGISGYGRKHYRMAAQFPVKFRIVKFQGELIPHLNEKHGTAVVHDLAESGLAFVSGLRLLVDMVIQVSFSIPDVGEFREFAQVVRSRNMGHCYLTGVRFIKIDEIRRAKLRDYIASEVKKKVRLIKYL